MDTDLGAVIQNGFSQVDVEILAEPADIDQMYIETLANLRTRKPAPKKSTILTEGEKEQQAKAYYANVRSNVSTKENLSPRLLIEDLFGFFQVLLTWVLSNVRKAWLSTLS